MEPMDNISRDDALELHARVSALNLLMRAACATEFQDKQPTFDGLMGQLLRLTREAPMPLEPTAAEALQDMQARTATHLLRFQQEVHAIWKTAKRG